MTMVIHFELFFYKPNVHEICDYIYVGGIPNGLQGFFSGNRSYVELGIFTYMVLFPTTKNLHYRQET
jgi:hypothetical protein